MVILVNEYSDVGASICYRFVDIGKLSTHRLLNSDSNRKICEAFRCLVWHIGSRDVLFEVFDYPRRPAGLSELPTTIHGHR